jgi:hypothetical protein
MITLKIMNELKISKIFKMKFTPQKMLVVIINMLSCLIVRCLPYYKLHFNRKLKALFYLL